MESGNRVLKYLTDLLVWGSFIRREDQADYCAFRLPEYLAAVVLLTLRGSVLKGKFICSGLDTGFEMSVNIHRKMSDEQVVQHIDLNWKKR